MSYEDDEYWEDEYSEYSFMPQSAVVQERHYERRTVPDPVIPTRRRPGEEVDDPRRRKRAAFDSKRPSWLDDPDFEPIDTSAPNLAGDEFDDIDFNRPELGVDFDKPDFPIVDPAARPELRRGARPQRGRSSTGAPRRPADRYDTQRYRDDAPERRDDERRGGGLGRRPVEVRPDEVREDEREAGPVRSGRRRPVEIHADEQWDDERRVPPSGRTIELRSDEYWEESPRGDRRGRGPARRRPAYQDELPEGYDDRDPRGRGPAWDDEDFGPIRPAGGRRPRRDDADPRRPGPARRDDRPAAGRAQVPSEPYELYRSEADYPELERDQGGAARQPAAGYDRRAERAASWDDERALDGPAPAEASGAGRHGAPADRALTSAQDERDARQPESGADERARRQPEAGADDLSARRDEWAARQAGPRSDERTGQPAERDAREPVAGSDGRPERVEAGTDTRSGRPGAGTEARPVQSEAGDQRVSRTDDRAARQPEAGPAERAGQRDEWAGQQVPAEAGSGAPDGQTRSGEPDEAEGGDSPRVLRRADPPVPPKVVSRATPPPQPRVIKAEPPVTPRVVAAPAPVPPARVVGGPPLPPGAAQQPAAHAEAALEARSVANPGAVPPGSGSREIRPVSPAGRASVPGSSMPPPVTDGVRDVRPQSPAEPRDMQARDAGAWQQPVPAEPRDVRPPVADGARPGSGPREARPPVADGSSAWPQPAGSGPREARPPVADGSAAWPQPAGFDQRGARPQPGASEPRKARPQSPAAGYAGGPARPESPQSFAGRPTVPGPLVSGEIRPGGAALPEADVPQQRPRRSPRTAHVFLSDGDGPWAMVPDANPSAGAGPVPPARPPMPPGWTPAPQDPNGTQTAPAAAWPPPVRPAAQPGVPTGPEQPAAATAWPPAPIQPPAAAQPSAPVPPVAQPAAVQPPAPVPPATIQVPVPQPAAQPPVPPPALQQPPAAEAASAWPPAPQAGDRRPAPGGPVPGTPPIGVAPQTPAAPPAGAPQTPGGAAPGTPPIAGAPQGTAAPWQGAGHQTPPNPAWQNMPQGGVAGSQTPPADGPQPPAGPWQGSPRHADPGWPGQQPSGTPQSPAGGPAGSAPQVADTGWAGPQPTAERPGATGSGETSSAGGTDRTPAPANDLAPGSEQPSATSAASAQPVPGSPTAAQPVATHDSTWTAPTPPTGMPVQVSGPAQPGNGPTGQPVSGASHQAQDGGPATEVPAGEQAARQPAGPAGSPQADGGAGRERIGVPAQRPAEGDDAPYMDAEGTWHNLRPIARLATSGPDPEPRRYSDTALGSGWFVTKAPVPAAQSEDAGAEQEAEGEPAKPAEKADQPAEPESESESVQPGTEQQGPELAPHLPLTAADLSAIRWRLDGASLREVVDDRSALRELGERLDGPLADEADNIVKAGLLSVRAEVYRLLGELGMAAAASRLALAHAESAQDLQSMVIAQAELAHVLRLRGDYLEADRLFQRAVDADVPAAVRSVVHENAGRSCYDQGRHMEALDHFARAIRLGDPEDTDLVERVGVCLESVYIHVLRDGWGPYPRKPAEILGLLSERLTDDADALDEATAEQPIIRPREENPAN